MSGTPKRRYLGRRVTRGEIGDIDVDIAAMAQQQLSDPRLAETLRIITRTISESQPATPRIHEISFGDRFSFVEVKVEDDQPEPGKALTRCHSILEIGRRLLPASVRDDAVDEWLDEIESAAEAGKPVLGRTISIVLTALPRAIWRAWVPIKATKSGS